MKITRVEAIPLAIPFTYGAEAFKLGTGSWKKLDFCLVRVETNSGLVGWGDAFAYTCRAAVVAAVRAMIAPLAVGHDATDIGGLHAKIQKQLHIFGRFGITAFALSALDIALWDIARARRRRPLPADRRRTARAHPCYATPAPHGSRGSSRSTASARWARLHRDQAHEVDDAAVRRRATRCPRTCR
jgi:hypothetical protein